MTVKELFQSLELKDIIEPMKKKYPDALLPLSEYKENYDIILNTVFSGEGGTITFRPDGNSNAYMTEGDRYFNIVGMEVVLPDNGAVTTAEAAAEILWCSAPFGRYGEIDWGDVADWPEEFEPGEPRWELALLEAKIGPLPERTKQSLLSSSSIEKVYYESQTYGKSGRIEYIADLLLNPLYNSKKYLDPAKKQECICVLYATPEHPCTTAEQNRIIEILGKYFGSTPWQLFTRQCKGLAHEAELDITYITDCE